MPQKFEIPEATHARLMTRQGRIDAYEWLDPKRTALLVVDMQNYFMAEGYQATARMENPSCPTSTASPMRCAKAAAR